jgi:arsenate reductase
MRRQPTILFLDRNNSDRSQIAEALFRFRAGQRFESRSAGLQPKAVSPLTQRVLIEAGIDPGHLSSKSVKNFLARAPVAYAILIGDRKEPGSPRIYPFATRTLRWECPDPSEQTGTERDKLVAFRQVRDSLDSHVKGLLHDALSKAA